MQSIPGFYRMICVAFSSTHSSCLQRDISAALAAYTFHTKAAWYMPCLIKSKHGIDKDNPDFENYIKQKIPYKAKEREPAIEILYSYLESWENYQKSFLGGNLKENLSKRYCIMVEKLLVDLSKSKVLPSSTLKEIKSIESMGSWVDNYMKGEDYSRSSGTCKNVIKQIKKYPVFILKWCQDILLGGVVM